MLFKCFVRWLTKQVIYSRPSVARTLTVAYHGCFELVLESLGKKSHSCKFGIIKGGGLFIENGILCVLNRIALLRRF